MRVNWLYRRILYWSICDAVNGLGYKQETHGGMVSPRLFVSADLQQFKGEPARIMAKRCVASSQVICALI